MPYTHDYFAKTQLSLCWFLVVDHHQSSREQLVSLLQQADATVSAAVSHQEAVQWLDRLIPTAIVYHLRPEDSRLDDAFLQAVRARPRVRGGQVPVIAVSDWGDSALLQQTVAAGFHACLSASSTKALLAVLTALVNHNEGC